MKTSELIKIIQKKMGNEDLEIEFQSYEWGDDLEYEEYFQRYFDCVERKNKKIIIKTSR